MNPEQQAAASIKKFLQAFKGLAELEPALTELGSIKQAENEIQSRIVLAQTNEAKAMSVLAELEAKIVEAKAKALSVEAEARTAAESIVAEAKASAKAAIDKAEARIKQADLASNSALTKLRNEIQSAEDRLDTLQIEIASATGSYKEIQSQLDTIVQRAGGRR